MLNAIADFLKIHFGLAIKFLKLCPICYQRIMGITKKDAGLLDHCKRYMLWT